MPLDDIHQTFPAAAELFDARRPAVIRDTRNDPRWVPGASSDQIRSWMGFPLQIGEELLGVLSVASHTAGLYTEADLKRLAPYAAQASIAIDRALISGQLQRRVDEVTALNDMARSITSMLDPDEILHYIMDQAQELFEAEAASIALIDEGSQTLTFHVAVGAGADGIIGQQLQMGQGIAGWVAETGEPACITNTRQDDRFMADMDRQTGYSTRSVMCAPMIVEDHIIGVVEIINRRISTVSEDDLRLLSAVSAQVGAAVDRGRMYHRARLRAAQMTALHNASVDLVGRTQLSDLFQTIADRTSSLLSTSGSRLYLLDDAPPAENGVSDHSILRYQAGAGIGRLEEPGCLGIGQDAAGEAVLSDQAVIVNDYASWESRSHLSGSSPAASIMSIPLRWRDHIIGALEVLDDAGREEFSQEDARLFELMGQIASNAIGNAKLLAETMRRAEELSVLLQTGHDITSSLDLQEVLKLIADRARRLLDADGCIITMRDAGQDTLLPMVNLGADASPIADTLTRWIATNGIGRIANHASPLASEGKCSMGVPLRSERDTIGVMTVSRHSEKPFSRNDLQFLDNLATQATIAISNARLYEERETAFGELQEAQNQLVQTEKLRALGQMASGIAHNFNNTLAIILGRAQLTVRRAGSDAIRTDLDSIVRATRDGAATARRLLEFTRQEPDQTSLSILDLNEIIQSVAEITRPRWEDQMQAEGRNVQLVTHTAEIPRVAGNAAEIREVLTNLIFNALDAMPAGGTITLSTGQKDGAATICVQDSGAGMPEEIQLRVFDPFFTTKGPQNSGLGLSTSYGIILRHGGAISVESEPGAGTTFTIALPAAEDSTGGEDEREAHAPAPSSRILIVDDEVELGEVIQQALQHEGHEAIAFSQGSEALTAFHNQPFDLVITDLGMPELSGWDIAGGIRKTDAEVPIVMITGWGDRLDDDQLQKYSIRPVIGKPFEIDHLIQVVAEILREISA